MTNTFDLALKLGIICDRLKIEVYKRVGNGENYDEIKSDLILQTAKLNVVYAQLSNQEVKALELIRQSRCDNSVIRATGELHV